MSHWFASFYADIEAMRLDAFADALAPDAEVTVGNNPTMKGRQASKEGIGYFFSSIAGIKHHVLKVIEDQGLTVLEQRVDYLRKDGGKVTVPVVTVMERKDGLVSSLRIYLDVAPVYA